MKNVKGITFCPRCGKWTKGLLGTNICHDCGGRK